LREERGYGGKREIRTVTEDGGDVALLEGNGGDEGAKSEDEDGGGLHLDGCLDVVSVYLDIIVRLS
jgi:hypothetical protein